MKNSIAVQQSLEFIFRVNKIVNSLHFCNEFTGT